MITFCKEAKDHGEGGNIVAALNGRVMSVITAGTAIREVSAVAGAQAAGVAVALPPGARQRRHRQERHPAGAGRVRHPGGQHRRPRPGAGLPRTERGRHPQTPRRGHPRLPRTLRRQRLSRPWLQCASVVLLAPRFVTDHRHGVGEVQARRGWAIMGMRRTPAICGRMCANTGESPAVSEPNSSTSPGAK